MQIGNTSYIYKNNLRKAFFQRDMVYSEYKDLTKRTESDKVLKNKAFHKLLIIQNITDIKED